MSDEHAVSRRASLRTLGAAGAAVVFGGTVSAQNEAAGKDAHAANVVDVAASRMLNGHS